MLTMYVIRLKKAEILRYIMMYVYVINSLLQSTELCAQINVAVGYMCFYSLR